MKKLTAFVIAVAILCMAAPAMSEAFVGRTIPGAIVKTADGAELAVSQLLEEKDAVVLAFFDAGSPDSRADLSMMERVWGDLSDRVEILAVSGGPADDGESLAALREELGLSLPVGQAGDLADRLAIAEYPTTLIIDRNGTVGYCQSGPFMSASQFKGIVRYFLAGHYDGTLPGCYNVYVRDQYGGPVPGAVIKFCDEACQLYTTDDEGIITFAGRPVRYNVQILKMPEGYSCDMAFESVCDGSGQWVVIEATRE